MIKKSKTYVTVQLDTEIHEQLQKIKKQTGSSVTWLVSFAIADWIQRHPGWVGINDAAPVTPSPEASHE